MWAQVPKWCAIWNVQTLMVSLPFVGANWSYSVERHRHIFKCKTRRANRLRFSYWYCHRDLAPLIGLWKRGVRRSGYTRTLKWSWLLGHDENGRDRVGIGDELTALLFARGYYDESEPRDQLSVKQVSSHIIWRMWEGMGCLGADPADWGGLYWGLWNGTNALPLWELLVSRLLARCQGTSSTMAVSAVVSYTYIGVLSPPLLLQQFMKKPN